MLKSDEHDAKLHNCTDEERRVLESAKKYDGLNEDSLINALMDTVKNAKDSGNFSREQILEFANSMMPYLSDAQRIKLVDLVRIISE